MDKVKIHIEILTPMFSYGNKGIAEFRITELKSLMRSTFREFYEFNDLQDMKEKEGALFGSTKNKSPIIFRLNSYEKVSNKKDYLLPHKKTEKEKNSCSCLEKKQEISLILLIKDNRDFYINLLLLASITGGLGKRSRKAFGAFKITGITIINDDKKDKIDLNFKNIDTLFERINEDKKYKLRKFEKESDNKYKFELYKGNELNFPYIKNLFVLPLKNIENLNVQVSKLTHDRLNRKQGSILDDSMKLMKNGKDITPIFILGNTKNKWYKINRFASPVCTTFTEFGDKKFMVIKELNYAYMINSCSNLLDKKIGTLCDAEVKDIKRIATKYVDNYIEKLKNIAEKRGETV